LIENAIIIIEFEIEKKFPNFHLFLFVGYVDMIHVTGNVSY